MAIVKLKLMGYVGIRFSVMRIDGLHLRKPRVWRFFIDQIDRSMNRHGIERIALKSKRLVSLVRCQFAIVIFQSKAGCKLMRLRLLCIKSESFIDIKHGFAIEAVCRYDGEA